MDTPHPKSMCGGAYQDWLEVNLTPDCNASCSWCVERRGWHPTYRAPWEELVKVALSTGKKNVILLGGEPTLHPNLQQIIRALSLENVNVWITTNGSQLSGTWVYNNLRGVCGVNLSVHDYRMAGNEEITGLHLDVSRLDLAILRLRHSGVPVRFNCNCIRGHVDSEGAMRSYIHLAKWFRATSVRFAELKFDDDNFVDLAKVLNHRYGLNDDPYRCGCSVDAVIDGMPVNFRQMCGMQTSKRPCPANPAISTHQVLYYDGKLYDGWQQKGKAMSNDRKSKTKEHVKQVLEDVKAGRLSPEGAANELDKAYESEMCERGTTDSMIAGGSCRY